MACVSIETLGIFPNLYMLLRIELRSCVIKCIQNKINSVPLHCNSSSGCYKSLRLDMCTKEMLSRLVCRPNDS